MSLGPRGHRGNGAGGGHQAPEAGRQCCGTIPSSPLSRRARRKSDRQNATERYIGEVVAGPLDWSPPKSPGSIPRVGAPSLTTSECVPDAVE
jgi:hypothetical protein